MSSPCGLLSADRKGCKPPGSVAHLIHSTQRFIGECPFPVNFAVLHVEFGRAHFQTRESEFPKPAWECVSRSWQMTTPTGCRLEPPTTHRWNWQGLIVLLGLGSCVTCHLLAARRWYCPFLRSWLGPHPHPWAFAHVTEPAPAGMTTSPTNAPVSSTLSRVCIVLVPDRWDFKPEALTWAGRVYFGMRNLPLETGLSRSVSLPLPSPPSHPSPPIFPPPPAPSTEKLWRRNGFLNLQKCALFSLRKYQRFPHLLT